MNKSSDLLQFLQGGGELGQLIREKDWSATPIGPVETWPQSLKTTLGIVLQSRYPMFVFWGPQLVKIYNDAYRPITGRKHPWALGTPAQKVWPEIWPDIEPLVDRALAGDPTWSDDLMLFMERNGFPEEVYFTFSYSPIPDESGGIGGMFCACTETTGRVLADRRLRTLRDLAAAPAEARTVIDAAVRSTAVLAANRADVPFAMVYLFDAAKSATLVATAGVDAASSGVSMPPSPGAAGEPAWPIGEVAESCRPQHIAALDTVFTQVPPGPWPEPPSAAMALPLIDRGQDRAHGVIVLGISSRRLFDDDYRQWFELVAGQVSASITNARADEDERRRADALAEIDRAKTEFFSNISHEFRTPLTLLLGPTEAALQSAEPTLRGDDLQIVHRNAVRLLGLVNNLLDFSRIEAGRAQAAREPTDLAELTRELTSLFRSAIESAGLKLRVDCPPLDEPIDVDPEMWEKIVFNLLSNAFKFTFEGEIAVALTSDGTTVSLSVQDTGTGIPEQQIPRIFERFYRVGGAEGRTSEGTGIGLALVQELTRLHGGSVQVTSTMGEGSRFVVSIPRRDIAAGAEIVRAARSLPSLGARRKAAVHTLWQPVVAVTRPSEPRTRPRILVVDDNADMRAYVERLLQASYEVVAVPDGVAALAAVREQSFDLVLSDVMMPRLGGIELLARLRADERTRTLPVILISARAGEESTVAGLDTGADDYLVKPFGANELLARVNARLELAAVRRRREEGLLDADRRKDEFLAMLAHELRNPLAPIRSAVEVLRLIGPSEKHQRWVREVVERQTLQLTRLVDDLLDVSRITRGKIALHLEQVSLASAIERAVETSRPLIDARRQHLTVTVPTSAVTIQGDLARLVQALGNLLNNAAKYTERGGRISIHGDGHDAEAIVTVRDSGIGISAELLPHVFDLFKQGDRTVDRVEGGLGIGLTLVRELIELHGGSVAARSDGPGRGSEFIVRLPASAQAATGPAKPTRHAPETPSPSVRILIVEDNADAAEMMAFLLTQSGHHVRTCSDAIAALEATIAFQPDVILCDLGLPGVSGYEFAKQARAQWPRIKLIALSGYGQEEDRRRSIAAGFDVHLVKPVEAEALQAILASLHPRL